MELDEEEQQLNDLSKLAASEERAMRRSSSRGREKGDGLLPNVAWDWRARQWVAGGQPHSVVVERKSSKPARVNVAGNVIMETNVPVKGQGVGRRSVNNRSRQSGWVSELEGISEKELYEPRRESGQIVARIRKDKVMIRSRRRGYHVVDVHSRRKLTRRDNNLRREMNARRSSSETSRGAVVSRNATVNPQALSLQALGESLHATKNFSLITLEEYLKERRGTSRHQQEEQHLGSFKGDIVVGSPTSARSSQFDSVPRATNSHLKYLEQPRRASTTTYVSGDAMEDDEADAEQLERSGCWHWSGSHFSKDDESYAGSCFPVSRRRIGRKMISRSRIGKYNSERSVSSFDSDMETVPLMTEPEPFHEYSEEVDASSVELDRDQSPRFEMLNEFKMRKYSRFKEDGLRSGGSSFHKMEENHEEQLIPMAALERRDQQHRSLGQKYRPKTFKDLVGQTMVAQSLSNAILRGKIAPVYLFHGPRGTGKTTAARIFTAAMNCLSIEELRPCGLCRECVALNSGRNFDVREVDAAGNNEIESMRVLLKHISLPPSSSRYKVFIIDECHALTAEAWNAFLKSLEEPPSYVVFILITTDLEQLPRTAISRCQKFLFPRIKDSDIVFRLRKLALQENIDVEQEALQLIASRSDGSLRDAETSLDQLGLLGKRVTLDIVQELVGLIPEDKLAHLLELALSADTMSTVKSLRDLVDSGVEPLALISQLATLITDILAGNNRAAGYKIRKVRKEEHERLRQALRVLSEAEKQLRSCSDRTTWLTAAFLQFAPSDSGLLPPSSLGTSVTQSPVNFLDTSEKETLELDYTGTRQSWDAEDKWDSRSQLQLQYMSASNGGPSNMDGVMHKRLDTHNHHFSSSFTGNKIYPCDQSPQSGLIAKEMKVGATGNLPSDAPRTYSSGVSKSDHREISTLSPCTMDNIWTKVLEGSRSNVNVLKQLLRGEGKLLSLSVTEAFAVAHLEFRYPEHKAMAERAKTPIANAFQVALGCPVEIEVSLSTSPGQDDFTHRGDSPAPGNLKHHSRHSRMASLPKADDGKAQFIDDEAAPQEQRRIRSGSFRKSSNSFKYVAPVSPSPRLRNLEHRKSKQSFELDGSVYQRRSVDLSNRDLGGERGKSKEGIRTTKSHHHAVHTHVLEKSKSVSHQHEVHKGSSYMGGHDPILQQSEAKSADGYNENLGHINPQSKEKVQTLSNEETNLCASMKGDDVSNDVDKDSSDSETQESYGPSLLCWKGNIIKDRKVKHQRLRRKRRTRFLLRLVPCAKEEGGD